MRTAITIVSLTLFALAPIAARADDLPNVNKRGEKGSEDERKFMQALAKAISEAAHSTGKNPAYSKFEYSEPRERRTVLTINLEYKGAVSGSIHKAEAILTFDTGDAKKWEILTIEFKDKDNAIPPSKEKLNDLKKKLNDVK
jgi:hypothetical protein